MRPAITEEQFDVWRRYAAFHVWLQGMKDRGLRLSTQNEDGKAVCFLGPTSPRRRRNSTPSRHIGRRAPDSTFAAAAYIGRVVLRSCVFWDRRVRSNYLGKRGPGGIGNSLLGFNLTQLSKGRHCPEATCK
jgi:hypothetical protein